MIRKFLQLGLGGKITALTVISALIISLAAFVDLTEPDDKANAKDAYFSTCELPQADISDLDNDSEDKLSGDEIIKREKTKRQRELYCQLDNIVKTAPITGEGKNIKLADPDTVRKQMADAIEKSDTSLDLPSPSIRTVESWTDVDQKTNPVGSSVANLESAIDVINGYLHASKYQEPITDPEISAEKDALIKKKADFQRLCDLILLLQSDDAPTDPFTQITWTDIQLMDKWGMDTNSIKAIYKMRRMHLPFDPNFDPKDAPISEDGLPMISSVTWMNEGGYAARIQVYDVTTDKKLDGSGCGSRYIALAETQSCDLANLGVAAGDKIKLGVNIYWGKDSKWTDDVFVYSPTHDLAIGYTSNGTTQNEPTPRLLVTGSAAQVKDAVSTEHHNIIKTILSAVVGFVVATVAAIITAVTFGALCPLTGLAAALVTGLVVGTVVTAVTIGVSVGFADKSITDVRLSAQNPDYHYFYDKYKSRYTINGFSFVPTGYYNATPVLHYIKPNGESGQFTYSELRLGKGEANVIPCAKWVGQKGRLKCEQYSIPDGSEIWFEAKVAAGDNRTIDESKKGTADYQHFTFSSRSPERVGYVVQGQTYTGDKKLHLVGFGQADEVWAGLSPYLSAARTEFITEMVSSLGGIALSVACEGIGFAVSAARAAKGAASAASKAADAGVLATTQGAEKGGAEATEAAARQIASQSTTEVVEHAQSEITAIADSAATGSIERNMTDVLSHSIDDSLFNQLRDAGVPAREIASIEALTPEGRAIALLGSATDALNQADRSVQYIPDAINALRDINDSMAVIRTAESTFTLRVNAVGITNNSARNVVIDEQGNITSGMTQYITQMVNITDEAQIAARRDVLIRSITTVARNTGKPEELLVKALSQLDEMLACIRRLAENYQALREIVGREQGVLQNIFGTLGSDGVYRSPFGDRFFRPSGYSARYASFFDFMSKSPLSEWLFGFSITRVDMSSGEVIAKSGLDMLIDGIQSSVKSSLINLGYDSDIIVQCIMTGTDTALASQFALDQSLGQVQTIVDLVESTNRGYNAARNAAQRLLDENKAFRDQLLAETANEGYSKMSPVDIYFRDPRSGGRSIISGQMPTTEQLARFGIVDQAGNILDQKAYDMIKDVADCAIEYRVGSLKLDLLGVTLAGDPNFTEVERRALSIGSVEADVNDFGGKDWSKASATMIEKWYNAAKTAMAGTAKRIIVRLISKYTANLMLCTERFLANAAETVAMTAIESGEIASDLYAVDVNEFALKTFVDDSYIRTVEGPVSCSASITPECLNDKPLPQEQKAIYSTLPTAPMVESLYATALNYITVPQIKNNKPKQLVESLSDPWDEYYCVNGILKGGSNVVGDGSKPYCDTGRASAQPAIKHHEAEATGESHYEDMIEEDPTVNQIALMKSASDEALLALHDITSGEVPELPENHKGLDKNPVDVSGFYGDSMLGEVVQEKWNTDNSGKVQSVKINGWVIDPKDVRDPFLIHITYGGKEIVVNQDDLQLLPNSSSIFPVKYSNLATFDNTFSATIDVSKLNIEDRDNNLDNVMFTAYNLKHSERSVLMKRDSNDVNLIEDGDFELGYFGHWQYKGDVVIPDQEKVNKTADEIAKLEQEKIADTFAVASDDDSYGGHYGQINIDKSRNADKVQKIYQRVAAEVDGIYTLNSSAEVKDVDAELSVLVNDKVVGSTNINNNVWQSLNALDFEAKRGDVIEVVFSAKGDGKTDGFANIDNVTLGYSLTEPSLSDLHFTMVGPKELKIGETGTFVVIPSSNTDAMFVETVTNVVYNSVSDNSNQSSATKICSSAGLGSPLNTKLTCGTNQITSSFIDGSDAVGLKPFQITVTPAKSGQMDIQMATRGGAGKSTLFTVDVSDEKYNALEQMNRWGSDDPRRDGYDMPDLFYLYPLQNPAKMQKNDIMDFIAVPNAYYLKNSNHINIDFTFPSIDSDASDESELQNIYQIGDESVFDSKTTAHLKFGKGNYKMLEPIMFCGTVNQMGDWYVLGSAYEDFNSELDTSDGRAGSWVDEIVDRHFTYHVGN